MSSPIIHPSENPEAQTDPTLLSLTLSNTINWWLAQEFASAQTGDSLNAYLDEYKAVIEGLAFDPFGGDPRNIFAVKAHSHQSRFKEGNPFWDGLVSEPEDDYMLARGVFACLMRLSGMRRLDALLDSKNAEDYLQKRPKSTEIDQKYIDQAIASCVAMRFGRTVSGIKIPRVPAVRVDHLRLRRDISLSTEHKMLEFVSAQARGDNEREKNQSLDHVKDSQQALLNMLLEIVLYGAQHRQNDIRDVPVLEAKSISLNPEIIYPFVEQTSIARAVLLGRSSIQAT